MGLGREPLLKSLNGRLRRPGDVLIVQPPKHGLVVNPKKLRHGALTRFFA